MGSQHNLGSVFLDCVIQVGDPVIANRLFPLSLLNANTVFDFALEMRLPVIGTRIMKTGNDKDGWRHGSRNDTGIGRA